MTSPDPFEGARAHRDAIAKEYGTYVAVTEIDILGGRAFNPGDPVPVSHVENGVVLPEQVAKKSTKAAAAAIEKG